MSHLAPATCESEQDTLLQKIQNAELDKAHIVDNSFATFALFSQSTSQLILSFAFRITQV
jgi:hypothetical protein